MTNRFYSVDNKLITNKLIKEYFNSFWFEISRQLKDDSYLAVILKIQFENENINSLSEFVKVNKDSKKRIIRLFSK